MMSNHSVVARYGKDVSILMINHLVNGVNARRVSANGFPYKFLHSFFVINEAGGMGIKEGIFIEVNHKGFIKASDIGVMSRESGDDLDFESNVEPLDSCFGSAATGFKGWIVFWSANDCTAWGVENPDYLAWSSILFGRIGNPYFAGDQPASFSFAASGSVNGFKVV
jgi:hypothetical protein